MKLTDLSVIKKIMSENELIFQKKFGQNFLINEKIPQRIAQECGAAPEDGILEIGPGIGTLTCELAQRYRKVVSVEIDSALIPVLHQTLCDFSNTEVIHADILKLNIPALLSEQFPGMHVTVCANLPYYITTPIIMHLLECKAPIENITIMIQKEVAQRLCAMPGSPEYGAITAAVNYYAAVKRLFTVSAGSFIPAPKVDSAVVRLSLYPQRPCQPEDEALMFRVIKAAFAMRRKTLSNTLGTEFSDIGKQTMTQIINESGFSPSIRGEALSIRDFCVISDKILHFYNRL